MTLDARDLGTVLGVWAHPDDEAFLSAGLMATAVDDGRRVVCVTATRGEAGFPDNDNRSIAERRALRASECAACLETLGVTEHHWLDYADGGCHLVDPGEPVAKLSALIDEIRPDTILTFGPEGMTGHDDHIAVSRWTTLAVRRAAASTVEAFAPVRLLYATKTPDWNERMRAFVPPEAVMMVEGMQPPAVEPDELAICFTATGPMLARKFEAMRAQASQVQPFYDMIGDEAFRHMIAEEFFRDAHPDDWR